MDGYGTPSNLNQTQFTSHMPITPPPASDTGARYALNRQQTGRVLPFAQSNYGAGRFTAWQRPDNATYGSATTGSFLNFDAMNRPAPGAVEVR